MKAVTTALYVNYFTMFHAVNALYTKGLNLTTVIKLRISIGTIIRMIFIVTWDAEKSGVKNARLLRSVNTGFYVR